MKKIIAETNIILELTAFVGWAVLMIYEITWSRVLGPYFWTSIFVWTSLIGIILASLSLGYHYWWKMADKTPTYSRLASILFLASLVILLTVLFQAHILVYFSSSNLWIKLNSVISSIVLFAPASILLWMISPFAVKLKLINVNSSGQVAWNLYAISTLWSIVWTFASGFYLIPMFWTITILYLLAGMLALNWLVIAWTRRMWIWLLLIVVISVFGYGNYQQRALIATKNLVDIDTEYNRVWIFNFYNNEKEPIRAMRINNENSSAMLINNPNGLVYEYTKLYDVFSHFVSNVKETLVIWGAWYSYPKHFLDKYKDSNVDVVEIDPGLTDLARKYFWLQDSSRMNIIHEDWRIYLNNSQKKYDVIFWDAFKSMYSIPFHLTTREFIQKEYDALNQSGIVLVNVISALEWEKSDFFRAEYSTYKTIFPQVYALTTLSNQHEMVQNIMLIALKSNVEPNFSNTDPEISAMLKNLYKGQISWNQPILTDDFAPVDYYINKAI